MTHTTLPKPEDDPFLIRLGSFIASRATAQMRQELTDAFILSMSLESAAPTQPEEPTEQPTELEQDNEDPVQQG